MAISGNPYLALGALGLGMMGPQQGAAMGGMPGQQGGGAPPPNPAGDFWKRMAQFGIKQPGARSMAEDDPRQQQQPSLLDMMMQGRGGGRPGVVPSPGMGNLNWPGLG